MKTAEEIKAEIARHESIIRVVPQVVEETHLSKQAVDKAIFESQKTIAVLEWVLNGEKPSHPAQGDDIEKSMAEYRRTGDVSAFTKFDSEEITVKDFEEAMEGIHIEWECVVGIKKAAQACYDLAMKVHPPANSSGNLAAGMDWEAVWEDFELKFQSQFDSYTLDYLFTWFKIQLTK